MYTVKYSSDNNVSRPSLSLDSYAAVLPSLPRASWQVPSPPPAAFAPTAIAQYLGFLCLRLWSPGFSWRPRSLPPSPREPVGGGAVASPWQPERPSRTPAGGLESVFSSGGGARTESSSDATSRNEQLRRLCPVFQLSLCWVNVPAPALPGVLEVRRSSSYGPGGSCRLRALSEQDTGCVLPASPHVWSKALPGHLLHQSFKT